jgi:hypothetical protein
METSSSLERLTRVTASGCASLAACIATGTDHAKDKAIRGFANGIHGCSIDGDTISP